jgi:hypothetical protein
MNNSNQEISIQRTSFLNGINTLGGLLRKIGLDPFKLNADKIITKAKKQAQYSGTLPVHAEEGLRNLIQSVNQESKINPFGGLALKGLLERTLYGRLKIEQALLANPRIQDSPIKEPVFIIGMPRTGTTILHALMHEDDANRSPLAWECLLPHPISTPQNFNENPSLNIVKKEFGQLFKLVPDFEKKHHMSAVSPQECIGIQALDFNSFQTSAQVYIPSYMNWFLNYADKLKTMRFHKTFLQYLESGGVKAERWLLKSPVHLIRLKEIFEVYPDAKIIMTHRHPAKVVASAASLISSVRSLYSDHESENRTGSEQCDMWSEAFNTFLDQRKIINKEDQIIDLRFEDFVQDQLGVVQKIYNKFGWELSESAQNNMQQFLAQNPKDKHGAHHYSLKDFGLSESIINDKFKRYINFLNNL